MTVAADGPLMMTVMGAAPSFRSPPSAAGARVAVIGRVEAGRGLHLGEGGVIRADGHFVRIGDGFSLGSYSTVHIAHEIYPTVIGDDVTVGDNAVVHACTIGSRSVIGDHAVILDGTVVGEDVVVEPGSIAFPRSQLSRGGLYAGMPARRVRDIEPGEVQQYADDIRRSRPARRGHAGQWAAAGEALYVAGTARFSGPVSGAVGSSVWFSCDLEARAGPIHIGAGTNIQDNTVIRAIRAPVLIGEESVVGHNVQLEDCIIGARSLIGIGSHVAAGTRVEDDVLLAAGARTAKGQVLESGWVWAHNPARKLAPLDSEKRAMIHWTVETYRGYAETFRTAHRQ